MKKLLLLILFFIVSITSVNAKVHYIGDVDDNGKISVSDYLLIRKHIIGTITLTDSENKRADVNRDNKISTADYISIRKIIINNETPVELPPEFQYIDIPTKDLCVAKTYNGQDQQLTTITSTTGYTLSNYNGKDAGEYTITAKLSQGYKWADNTDTDKTFKCSIDKATNAITITKKTYTYDGKGKAATVTATYGTPTVTYYTDSSCKTKTTTANATSTGGTPKAAGTYYAKATVDASTNYKAESTGCKEAVVITRQYTVTYKPNGGSGSNTTQTVDYNTDWTTKGSIFTRTNYNLAGWSTSASGSVTHNLNKAQGKWTSSSDLTLYAVWQAKQYKLTYNANGGSVSPASKNITYGGTYGTLPTPTRSGYTFIGWYTSSTNGFDAEYYANKYADLKAAYGSNSTSLLNHWVDNGMREGRISSSTYVKSDMAHGATADKTIYAHWRANTYSVTYNPNGGSGSNVSQNITYNTDWTTKDKIFTRDGYELVGWSTTANGNITHNLNKTQGKWTNASHLTLYAVWNKVSSYVITKDYAIPSDYTVTSKVYDSATLKYKVIKKKDATIYFALIWVEDPYNQLNNGNSDYTVKSKLAHFNNEIGSQNLGSKGMIGTNGGFMINKQDNIPLHASKGVYRVNPNYATTYNGSSVVYSTLAMNSSGKLIYGTYSNASSEESWYKSNGVRNAWAITDFTTNTNQQTAVESSDARTNICQIDEHNFVLSVAYTSKIHHLLHDTFGCTAVANLDGGGSVGMYYKTNSMSRIDSIYQYKRPSESNYRDVADILYFREK